MALVDRPRAIKKSFHRSISPDMDKRLLPAQRRLAAERATIAVVALLWLTCLVLGVGGPRATQAISNFGLIAAAASAGLACLATARRSSAQHRRMWKLLGVSALSWGSGQAAWTWYESVLGREVPFPSLADVGYLAACRWPPRPC